MKRQKKEPSEPALVMQKIRHFCSYQERYIREVEDKLKEWAVQKQKIPDIINQLQKEGFINEERFVRAFAGGKFRLNTWGRQKIAFEMKIKGIPELMIEEGLTEIDKNEYRQVLKDLILRKEKELKPEKNFTKRQKIINFVNGKGYEINLILEILKELKI